MVSVTRLAAVGAFVIGGLLLFAVGLFLIGDRRLLFDETFGVYAEFSTIAGLDRGAAVRVAGMDAGEVERIHVPAGPSARFRVRMRVREDVRPLIRLDSVASIQNDGLVGNKFVQIETGTEQSAVVPDEGTIRSREPLDMADLLQKMSDTVDVVNQTVLALRDDIEAALSAVSDTAVAAQGLVDDVGRDARQIMASTERVTTDLQAIVAGVREGRGTVGKFLTDDALYERVKTIAGDAERAVANLRQASEDARAAVADFRGDGGPMKGLTGNLQQTLVAARDVMSDLAENTEALKRSFFFRGFFNRRGFYDLDDLTVQEYRAGILEAADRRPLRIWIRADLLFERDANGRERLSDGGQARLDSAMSQFLEYPRTSPLVVEGYAQGPTAGERQVLSRARAAMARDYVVSRFSLDPNYTTSMAMGSEAEGSPSGNSWDGVALAIFVSRKGL